jgi:hypothetical protein
LNMMEGVCGVGNGFPLSSGRFGRLSRSCGVVVGVQEVVTMGKEPMGGDIIWIRRPRAPSFHPTLLCLGEGSVRRTSLSPVSQQTFTDAFA